MRRGILGIVGSRVTDVERVACRRRPIEIAPRIDRFRRRAVGCFVTEVGRVGKRVVVHLDSRDAIVLEPRMTGLVLVAEPPTREHLRFRCTLSGNGIGEFLYWDRRGLGNVRLISPNEFEEAFGPAKVGPDALTITAELYRERLGGSQRAVKGCAARSAGRGRDWQLVCVGDFASCPHPSGASVRQAYASPMAASGRRNAFGAGDSDSLRRLDARRRHVSQRVEPGGRLSESSSRVRPRRRNVPALRQRRRSGRRSFAPVVSENASSRQKRK